MSKQLDQQTIINTTEPFVKALLENGEPTGLNLDIEQFLLDYVENKPAASTLATHIHNLRDLAKNGHKHQTEAILRYFLGRGIGSTPAGDDHVIGLLGIHTLTNALHPDFVQTIEDLTESENITTRAGHYYIRHALNGTFLPSFARILNGIEEKPPLELQEQITRVLPIGHTSGIDTTFGMLLGILVLKEKVGEA